MRTTGTYIEQDPTREWVRNFVSDVSAGGPGGTYGPAIGRFVVGGWVPSLVLRKYASHGERTRHALDYAGRYAAAIPHTGLGYWRDAQGRTWLDVIRATDDIKEALTWALDNGEIAIFDREEDIEVKTEVVLAAVSNAWGQAE